MPKDFALYNIDDILIHADNKKDLEQYTKMLQRLWENEMYLKLKKCEFAKERIEYLRMIISYNLVSMDLVKLAGIQNWPTPKAVKQVQLFLGFGNYYQWFIKKFPHLAQPLNNLLKKDAKFE